MAIWISASTADQLWWLLWSGQVADQGQTILL
jgi:hypothetical protein